MAELPINLALSLSLMRAIAEGLIFREAATTELWVLDRLNHIAVGIDDIDNTCDADRSALRVNESLCIRHELPTY
mgnify:CR=1 FL=1